MSLMVGTHRELYITAWLFFDGYLGSKMGDLFWDRGLGALYH